MMKKISLKSFATLLAIVVIGTVLLAACATAAPAGDHDVPKPSNAGGTGPAVTSLAMPPRAPMFSKPTACSAMETWVKAG